MPGLLTTKQIPGAANLQILHGDGHARTQVGVSGHRRQAVVSRLGEWLVRRVQEVGIATLPRPPHTTTQLVQLRQPHKVSSIDEQSIGGRNVDTRLNDRRAYQDVGTTLPEVHHDLFQLFLVHLAVRSDNPRFWNKFTQLGSCLFNGLHAVVDVKDLTFTSKFTPDRRNNLPLVIGSGESEHRVTLLWWGGDRTHLADACHRHLQGARDRRSAHSKHIDVDPHAFKRFFVLDAKTLFLVDDDQAEILELNLLGQQAMGTDDDVDGTALKSLEGFAGFGVSLETRQGRHLDGETCVTLSEGLEMLLHQQSSGHQHRHLLAVLNRLKRSTYRDLGFTVADITTDQPVHRNDLLHVTLNVGNGGELVRCLDVSEGALQLPLPRSVRAESMPLSGLASSIELDELGGDFTDRLAGTRLALAPVSPTHTVEAGGIPTDISGHLIQRVHRHEEAITRLTFFGGRVLDNEVLAGSAADSALHHLHVPPHTVLLVDDEIARLELQGLDLISTSSRHATFASATGILGLGEVTGGSNEQFDRLGREPMTLVKSDDLNAWLGGIRVDIVNQSGRDVVLPQQLGHAFGHALTLGAQQDRPAVVKASRQILNSCLDVAMPRLNGHELGINRLRSTGDVVVDEDISCRRIQRKRGHRPPGHAAL